MMTGFSSVSQWFNVKAAVDYKCTQLNVNMLRGSSRLVDCSAVIRYRLMAEWLASVHRYHACDSREPAYESLSICF